ncbi:septum formation initiator family protein [Streptomyces sp. NPDC049954]|uniref:septum formation initiator family protein n=1 Tax=Streptomyces sp. NPDC049954 TaxID=3155779 RepID=UPI00342028C9
MTGRKALRGRAAALARLLPTGSSGAAKAPFVLLVVLLLGGGLITLLVLNSSLNEGSFQLSRLKKQTTDLTDEQQELQRDVDGYAAPDALARRAAELGMVPGGTPAFLGPDGTVRGVPSAAPEDSALRRLAERPQDSPPPAEEPSADPGSPTPQPSPAESLAGGAPLAPAPLVPSPSVVSTPDGWPSPSTSSR